MDVSDTILYEWFKLASHPAVQGERQSFSRMVLADEKIGSDVLSYYAGKGFHVLACHCCDYASAYSMCC